jgi:hypothetical protein
MAYTALNGGVAFVTGQPWAYQDANDARLDLADHETRLLAEEAATAAAILSKSITTANGASWTWGASSEEITLSTVGLTTDSVANLLPANSIIEAVVARITTTITTTTNWAVGDGTTSARFSSANATLTAGTTSVGLNHQKGGVTTDAAGPTQTAAAKVRVTCTGANPGAGKIRVTVFWKTYVPPTS